MGLLDIVRSGVAIADTLTKDLQPTVIREAFTSGQDVKGEPNRAAPVNVSAIVEMKQQMVKSPTGSLVASRAKVTFLDASLVIHAKDRLTLPDGTKGPIIAFEGLVDRGTGKPILTEVYIG
jgi:hypothetical protein